MNVIALVLRLQAIPYSRYLAISIVALALDLGLFLLLGRVGLPLTVVAVLSYSAGIAAHWLLSSRLVFAAELQARGQARARQQALFLLSALVGLAITTAVVSLASLALDPRVAKLLAVGLSFQATYLLRSRVVFA